jgi:hypothetical protein
VQPRLAARAELDLLLGVGRAARARLPDRGVERGAVAEDLRGRRLTSFLRDSSNRFSAAGLAQVTRPSSAISSTAVASSSRPAQDAGVAGSRNGMRITAMPARATRRASAADNRRN